MHAVSGRRFVCAAGFVYLVSWTAGCGGSGGAPSPTHPTSTSTTPPVPWNQWALKGRVVETLTDKPIEGAKLTFTLAGGLKDVTTAADGAWELTQASSEVSSVFVEVSAEGYVTRRTYVRWNIGTRDEIAIDLIRDNTPFSSAYYRELARDQFDKPNEALQPLWRWTKAPNFYINTLNPKTERDILPSELDMVTSTIRSAVSQMTGGVYEAGSIETGSGDRADQPGFIKVSFVHDPAWGYCGQALVGSDPGWIKINYDVEGCSSPCGAFPPRTVAHEVGHAMGFFHVSQGSILNTKWFARDCGVTTYSEAERYHARIAYHRPRMNREPDTDPQSAPLLRPPDVEPRVVTCYR